MSVWQLFTTLGVSAENAVGAYLGQGYRPPQWGFLSPGATQLIYLKTNINGYFFDAVLRADHNTSLRITEHPVQTGAALTDHSFQIPARLTLEIGMSDVMDSFLQGQYTPGAGKSVSAYQTFLALQSARTPLTVVTRLNTYTNMLIRNIDTPDTNKTYYGLRATISLKQILMAYVATQAAVPAAAQQQSVAQTVKGSTQPTTNAANGLSIPSSSSTASSSVGANSPAPTTTQLSNPAAAFQQGAAYGESVTGTSSAPADMVNTN